jgi:hypothetical protein
MSNGTDRIEVRAGDQSQSAKLSTSLNRQSLIARIDKGSSKAGDVRYSHLANISIVTEKAPSRSRCRFLMIGPTGFFGDLRIEHTVAGIAFRAIPFVGPWSGGMPELNIFE